MRIPRTPLDSTATEREPSTETGRPRTQTDWARRSSQDAGGILIFSFAFLAASSIARWLAVFWAMGVDVRGATSPAGRAAAAFPTPAESRASISERPKDGSGSRTRITIQCDSMPTEVRDAVAPGTLA